MSEYICDDRNNTKEHYDMIRNMTDEEFEVYCQKLKEKEEK